MQLLRIDRKIIIFAPVIWAAVLIGSPELEAQRFRQRTKSNPAVAPESNVGTQQGDEVWLVSTHRISPLGFKPGELLVSRRQNASWSDSDITGILQSYQSSALPTIIYIHGNLMNESWAKYRGLQVYDLLRSTGGQSSQSIRFVIWAWPSDDLGKPVRNYLPTVNRSMDEGCVLGWFLSITDRPQDSSIFGFSLGAQVAVSALEQIDKRYRVGAVAPVFSCRWPCDICQVKTVYANLDSLLSLASAKDYAVRAYQAGCGIRNLSCQLSFDILDQIDCEGKVCQLDVTRTVGRIHAIQDYCASTEIADQLMTFLLRHPTPNISPGDDPLVTRPLSLF